MVTGKHSNKQKSKYVLLKCIISLIIGIILGSSVIYGITKIFTTPSGQNVSYSLTGTHELDSTDSSQITIIQNKNDAPTDELTLSLVDDSTGYNFVSFDSTTGILKWKNNSNQIEFGDDSKNVTIIGTKGDKKEADFFVSLKSKHPLPTDDFYQVKWDTVSHGILQYDTMNDATISLYKNGVIVDNTNNVWSAVWTNTNSLTPPTALSDSITLTSNGVLESIADIDGNNPIPAEITINYGEVSENISLVVWPSSVVVSNTILVSQSGFLQSKNSSTEMVFTVSGNFGPINPDNLIVDFDGDKGEKVHVTDKVVDSNDENAVNITVKLNDITNDTEGYFSISIYDEVDGVNKASGWDTMSYIHPTASFVVIADSFDLTRNIAKNINLTYYTTGFKTGLTFSLDEDTTENENWNLSGTDNTVLKRENNALNIGSHIVKIKATDSVTTLFFTLTINIHSIAPDNSWYAIDVNDVVHVGAVTGTTLTLNNQTPKLKLLILGETPNLKTLNCNQNNLTTLDIEGCAALESLDAAENSNLATLDVSSNTLLKTIKVGSDSKLTNFDLTKNIQLTYLSMNGNSSIKQQLDLSKNTLLQYIYAHNCTFESISFNCAGSLIDFDCGINSRLTSSLDFSGYSQLKNVICYMCGKIQTVKADNCPLLVKIDCYSCNISTLTTLNDIALSSIYCRSNAQLESLNLSTNTNLKTLSCYECGLTGLVLTNNILLESLTCYNNTSLGNISFSTNINLITLSCANCGMSSLNVSANVVLQTLDCSSNNIETLNVSANIALKTLDCSSNSIASLDVGADVVLTKLTCSDNVLTELISTDAAALQTLICNNNVGFTTLQITNTTLKTLECKNCGLSTLNIGACIVLESLDCSQNAFTSGLNINSNTSLTRLEVYGCSLSSLDVSYNSQLSYLYCSLNAFTTLDVSNNPSLTSLMCVNCSVLASLYLPATPGNTNLKPFVEGDAVLTDIYTKCMENPASGALCISNSFTNNLSYIWHKKTGSTATFEGGTGPGGAAITWTQGADWTW